MTSEIPCFTKEQKEYLTKNLLWVGSAWVKEWISYLKEPEIQESPKFPSETVQDYIARLRKAIIWHKTMIANREREIRKVEKENGIKHEIH